MINPMLKVPRDKLPEFCRAHHISELAVFGSATRADFRPDESDIDLLVTFDPDAKFGLLTYNRIARELSELFGRKVDLVEKRGLKPAIRESVLGSEVILYAK